MATSLPSSVSSRVCQTWVRRPRCTGVAIAITVVPSLAPPMMLVLLSRVVVPLASSARLITVAAAPTESANAMIAPPSMMWWRVQRSGRTSIRATTRSFSASRKVTPLSPANGSFIDWIFSSGVIECPSPLLPSGHARAWHASNVDLSRLLDAAPFRDEQRGRLGRFAQRLQIDIFVEAMHRSAAGAEAQARDVVVQPIEAGIGERGEHEILHGAAIDRIERPAERRFRRGRILQFIAFREEARPFYARRVVGEEAMVARSFRNAG